MNEIELTPKQIVAELDKYIVGRGGKRNLLVLPCATTGAVNLVE